MAKVMFQIGDKVVHKNDATWKGTVTKTKYVPKKGLSGGDFQWLYIDGSNMPSGGTSEDWELDKNEEIQTPEVNQEVEDVLDIIINETDIRGIELDVYRDKFRYAAEAIVKKYKTVNNEK